MYIYCLASCLRSIVFGYYWIYRVYFGFSLINNFQRIKAGRTLWTQIRSTKTSQVSREIQGQKYTQGRKPAEMLPAEGRGRKRRRKTSATHEASACSSRLQFPASIPGNFLKARTPLTLQVAANQTPEYPMTLADRRTQQNVTRDSIAASARQTLVELCCQFIYRCVNQSIN